MKKYKFLLMSILPLMAKSTLAQYNYDSISICHNTDKKLQKIKVGEYNATFSNGKLETFYAENGCIKYSEEKRLLSLFYRTNGDVDTVVSISLKLEEEMVIRYGDSSKSIRSLKAMDPGLSIIPEDTSISFSFGKGIVFTEYKYGILQRFHVKLGNKTASVLLSPTIGIDMAIAVETNNKENQVSMILRNRQVSSLTILDSRNKVGIRLVSKENGNYFERLNTVQVVELNNTVSTFQYYLYYDQKGQIKKNKSVLTLHCNHVNP